MANKVKLKQQGKKQGNLQTRGLYPRKPVKNMGVIFKSDIYFATSI